MREKHIEFIKEDTQKRNETITSNIRFIGVRYTLKVKQEGKIRNKTIWYTAAKSAFEGDRIIEAQV